jgi:hypothetical protein
MSDTTTFETYTKTEDWRSGFSSQYNGLTQFAQESMFTQSLIHEITGERLPAIIYEHDFEAIYLVKYKQVLARTKPIDVRHHCLRDLHEDRQLEVRFKREEPHLADIMTKKTPHSIHKNILL